MGQLVAYPTSETFQGNLNMPWMSTFSDHLKPFVSPTLYRETGYGERVMDWLDMAGQSQNLKRDTLEIHYESDIEKTVEISSAISTGSAGANISVVVASDQDANGNPTLRVGEGVVIPSQYTSSGQEHIYVATAYNSGTDTFTCEALSADGTGGATQAQIGTEVPANTKLKIHGYYTGRGTDMPAGTTFNWSTRNFTTAIAKEKVGIVGGLQAQQLYVYVDEEGNPVGMWSTSFQQSEFLLQKKKGDMLFLSEANDNSSLTETSTEFGGSSARKSTKGLWNHAVDEGQTFNYSGSFAISDFYSFHDLKRTQNLISRDFVFWTGSELMRSVEQSSTDYIAQNSGGTNLLDAGGKLGVNVKYIELDGNRFALSRIDEFDNPQGYGGNAYEWIKRGLIVPAATANVRNRAGQEKRQPILQIGYLVNNGENREYTARVINGMTNYLPYSMNTADGLSYNLQCEFMTICIKPNWMFPVIPTT